MPTTSTWVDRNSLLWFTYLMDRAFLRAQSLLWLALVAPVLTLFIGHVGSAAPSLNDAAACLFATWICTVVAGIGVHGAVVVAGPWLVRVARPRALAVGAIALLTAATSAAILALLLPRLAWLSPSIAGDLPSLVLRGVAVAELYVVVARIAALRAERSRREEERARALEKNALLARLAALQAQMNPHFLFNTLNAIASLIPDDPALAETMIERLAGVLQYALEAGKRGTVSLGEELAAVRDYLGIEQARFGARLRSSIDVSPELHALALPPMLLQPLVENAVLHGLAGRDGGGEITITARGDEQAVVLTVADDGVGPGGSSRSGTRTGLSSVRERLALTYGDAALFAVRERAGGGFECELRVPRRSAVH
jgi:two-component system sensor histidine kinase AlgZ